MNHRASANTHLSASKSQFYHDVISGLSSSPKYLLSKYFYDTNGDILFQQIMNCPEYYLTNCEMEILSGQTEQITGEFLKHFKPFDLVELGAGDATKSIHLLKSLTEQQVDFTYLPIDISGHVISLLKDTLPRHIPGLSIIGLEGEYFDMLEQAGRILEPKQRNKVVLFLGANIGNMLPADAESFCRKLHSRLSEGDLLLLGFDLKKHPRVILNAYNDKAGITKNFNLNLLKRINGELGADFDINNFEHYATYDPATGSCKSYLISLEEQTVHIGEDEILFKKDEYMAMEISQKYSIQETDLLARATGFKPLAYFFDSKNWFADVLWQRSV